MYLPYLIIYPSKFPKVTFTYLAQLPSLDGEGAEGGWGDMKLSE